MGKVVGAVTGKEAGQKDLRQLSNEIRHDKEAQSAVESINSVLNGSTAGVKYCPIDGERYSSKFEVCPKHHVPLKTLEE